MSLTQQAIRSIMSFKNAGAKFNKKKRTWTFPNGKVVRWNGYFQTWDVIHQPFQGLDEA